MLIEGGGRVKSLQPLGAVTGSGARAEFRRIPELFLVRGGGGVQDNE